MWWGFRIWYIWKVVDKYCINTVANQCIQASDAEDSADENEQFDDEDQTEENELTDDHDQSGEVKFNRSFYNLVSLGSQWVMCSIKQLLQLAHGKCRDQECNCSRKVCYEVAGSCIEINGTWDRFYWSSSEFHINKNHSKKFDSNLLLASGIFLLGNSYTKIRVLFDFMQLAIIYPTTFYQEFILNSTKSMNSCFYNFQRHFICPTVEKYYTDEQVYKAHAHW